MADTPEQFARRLQSVGDARLDRRAERALKKLTRRVVTHTTLLFRRRGVGRRLFGRNGKGARALIRALDPERREGVLTQVVQLRGLAAIQEDGGRIAPHKIPKALAARSLARRAAKGVGGPTPIVLKIGGDFVTASQAKGMQHPGANMPAIPALGPAIEEMAPASWGEQSDAMDEHLGEVFG